MERLKNELNDERLLANANSKTEECLTCSTALFTCEQRYGKDVLPNDTKPLLDQELVKKSKLAI